MINIDNNKLRNKIKHNECKTMKVKVKAKPHIHITTSPPPFKKDKAYKRAVDVIDIIKRIYTKTSLEIRVFRVVLYFAYSFVELSSLLAED